MPLGIRTNNIGCTFESTHLGWLCKPGPSKTQKSLTESKRMLGVSLLTAFHKRGNVPLALVDLSVCLPTLDDTVGEGMRKSPSWLAVRKVGFLFLFRMEWSQMR